MIKRKTIGLIINGLEGNYQTYLWRMIKRSVEKLDCNLIVYEGRSPRSSNKIDNQHHIIYNFVDKNRIDGLIITSAGIGEYISYGKLIEICNKFKGIPTISMGIKIPGATSEFVDHKEGMKNLIRHLVIDHGYKKIAFVTGPEKNIDSVARLEAYLEVLKESSIEYDENLVFRGDFVSQTGYFIMKEILDKSVSYDAIVFANDDMALGAMKYLKELDSQSRVDFKKKCIICGFDDCLNASLVTPSLTTVRQPIEEMCYSAVELILRKIDGENIDDVISFPSVLVKRESCGCEKDTSVKPSQDHDLRLIPGYRIHENIQTYLLDELFDNIDKTLKMCNIRSCFISKYSEGTVIYSDDCLFDNSFSITQDSDLMYAFYNNKRISFGSDIKNFKTKDMVPAVFMPMERRFTYLLNPLFFRDEHFGFVCFEVENDDVTNIEPLRGQISNTLKGALMLIEREKMEESLRESERLASLGQIIGGMSHNLMSPIMSMSGAFEGLRDLINEYRISIDDLEVTKEDHDQIVLEMYDWLDKMSEYNSYMSKVISTVRKQAIQLNSHAIERFNLIELLNRINLFKDSNELLKKCVIDISVNVDVNTVIKGDIANLIQIVSNVIMNSAQSYEDLDCEKIINLMVLRDDVENSIVFKVTDYGIGINKSVKDKIFKHMITTKGKKGTGLSLLLSYSTIKGKFGGNIWFESGENRGTTFYITVPE